MKMIEQEKFWGTRKIWITIGLFWMFALQGVKAETPSDGFEKHLQLATMNAGEMSHEMSHGNHNAPESHSPGHANSVYQIDFTWETQSQKKIQSSDLRGKFQLVILAYTECSHACPILVADLKHIEGLIPKGIQEQVGFVFVSIDPERDTPDQLHQFSKKMDLGTGWHLLHGDSTAVMGMAALLGVKFRQEPDGSFSHSNLITLLDPEGKIVFRLEGLQQNPDALVHLIIESV